MKDQINDVYKYITLKQNQQFIIEKKSTGKKESSKPQKYFTEKSSFKEYTPEIDKTVTQKIKLYKKGKITQDELIKGLKMIDSVYYDKGKPVFCNCLLERPCKLCNPKEEIKEENKNILLSLILEEIIDDYVKIIYKELGRDQRNKVVQNEYFHKSTILKHQIYEDVNYVVVQNKITDKSQAEYMCRITSLVLYQKNSISYDLIFDQDIFEELYVQTEQSIQTFLINYKAVDTFKLSKVINELWDKIEPQLKTKKKELEVDQEEEEVLDETDQNFAQQQIEEIY